MTVCCTYEYIQQTVKYSWSVRPCLVPHLCSLYSICLCFCLQSHTCGLYRGTYISLLPFASLPNPIPPAYHSTLAYLAAILSLGVSLLWTSTNKGTSISPVVSSTLTKGDRGLPCLNHFWAWYCGNPLKSYTISGNMIACNCMKQKVPREFPKIVLEIHKSTETSPK